jgi:hypothetical protein
VIGRIQDERLLLDLRCLEDASLLDKSASCRHPICAQD